ncbi:hypothetical protein ACTXT7_008076 [Hymenolepis weldensis]
MSLLGSMMHALQRVGSYRRSSNSPSNAPVSPGHAGTNSLSPTQNVISGVSKAEPVPNQKTLPTLQVPTLDQVPKELPTNHSTENQKIPKKNQWEQTPVTETDQTEGSSEISEEIPLKQFYVNRRDSEKLGNASVNLNFGNRKSGFPNLPVLPASISSLNMDSSSKAFESPQSQFGNDRPRKSFPVIPHLPKKSLANIDDAAFMERRASASNPSQRYAYVKKQDRMKKYTDRFSEEDEEDGNAPLLHASEMERRFPQMPKVTNSSAVALPPFHEDLELRMADMPGEFVDQVNGFDFEVDEPELDASYFSRGDTPSPAPSINIPSSVHAFGKWPDRTEREAGWTRSGRKSAKSPTSSEGQSHRRQLPSIPGIMQRRLMRMEQRPSTHSLDSARSRSNDRKHRPRSDSPGAWTIAHTPTIFKKELNLRLDEIDNNQYEENDDDDVFFASQISDRDRNPSSQPITPHHGSYEGYDPQSRQQRQHQLMRDSFIDRRRWDTSYEHQFKQMPSCGPPPSIQQRGYQPQTGWDYRRPPLVLPSLPPQLLPQIPPPTHPHLYTSEYSSMHRNFQYQPEWQNWRQTPNPGRPYIQPSPPKLPRTWHQQSNGLDPATWKVVPPHNNNLPNSIDKKSTSTKAWCNSHTFYKSNRQELAQLWSSEQRGNIVDSAIGMIGNLRNLSFRKPYDHAA